MWVIFFIARIMKKTASGLHITRYMCPGSRDILIPNGNLHVLVGDFLRLDYTILNCWSGIPNPPVETGDLFIQWPDNRDSEWFFFLFLSTPDTFKIRI